MVYLALPSSPPCPAMDDRLINAVPIQSSDEPRSLKKNGITNVNKHVDTQKTPTNTKQKQYNLTQVNKCTSY